MSGRRDKDLVAPVAEIAPLRWVLLCLRRVRARIRRGPSILPSRWQPVALAIAAVLIGTSLSFANDGEETRLVRSCKVMESLLVLGLERNQDLLDGRLPDHRL